jgi:hypothetical protein
MSMHTRLLGKSHWTFKPKFLLPDCHIGLDLVVPLQDQEEMVEVLDAHVYSTKIINNEAKLYWPPFVFPKAWCCRGFIVALFF